MYINEGHSYFELFSSRSYHLPFLQRFYGFVVQAIPTWMIKNTLKWWVLWSRYSRLNRSDIYTRLYFFLPRGNAWFSHTVNIMETNTLHVTNVNINTSRTHTHTHTHIYIYIYIRMLEYMYVYVRICQWSVNFPYIVLHHHIWWNWYYNKVRVRHILCGY